MSRFEIGVLCLMMCISAFSIGVFCGACLGTNITRAEAMDHNKGEYYLDEKNERQWRWKP